MISTSPCIEDTSRGIVFESHIFLLRAVIACKMDTDLLYACRLLGNIHMFSHCHPLPILILAHNHHHSVNSCRVSLNLNTRAHYVDGQWSACSITHVERKSHQVSLQSRHCILPPSKAREADPIGGVCLCTQIYALNSRASSFLTSSKEQTRIFPLLRNSEYPAFHAI